MPLDWAMTQNNLGNALRTLGERESGTARLEEAVTAYRDALTERTRERVPLDWATTQNNLGNALWTLGERESGTARLEEAVTAYRDALKEYDPRARAARLGDDAEQPRQRACDARANARAARRGWRRPSPPTATRSEERTRERVPLDWAMTQNNLGNALWTLGRTRERHGAAGGGGRRLPRRAQGKHPRARAAPLGDDAEQPRQRAHDARGTRERHRAARRGRHRLPRRAQERTRERVPLDWATTQNNLGTALRTLGERESGTARLEEAVTAYRDALDGIRPASACRSTGR